MNSRPKFNQKAPTTIAQNTKPVSMPRKRYASASQPSRWSNGRYQRSARSLMRSQSQSSIDAGPLGRFGGGGTGGAGGCGGAGGGSVLTGSFWLVMCMVGGGVNVVVVVIEGLVDSNWLMPHRGASRQPACERRCSRRPPRATRG